MPIINDDGNFTDDFKTNLPGYLGDDHKDYKGLDEVKSIAGLVKFAADNQVAARSKMDGHVKIPGEGSTDDERAEFRTKSLTALDMLPPESSEGYEFPSPEGMETNAEADASLKKIFYDAGMPKAMASKVIESLNAQQVKSFQDQAIVQDAAFKQESESLKADYPGDKLPASLREAYNLIVKIMPGGDIEAFKRLGLYDNPTDLKKWQEAGYTPKDLAEKIKLAKMVQGSSSPAGGAGGSNGPSELEQAKKLYPNSSDMWPKE